MTLIRPTSASRTATPALLLTTRQPEHPVVTEPALATHVLSSAFGFRATV